MATTKPRYIHQLSTWRSVICHFRECVCADSLWRPGAERFTSLHLTLLNALDDALLWCSCLATEIHSMSSLCTALTLGVAHCFKYICRISLPSFTVRQKDMPDSATSECWLTQTYYFFLPPGPNMCGQKCTQKQKSKMYLHKWLLLKQVLYEKHKHSDCNFSSRPKNYLRTS